MNQVESLLKPVKDEDDRLKMVAGDLLNSVAVKPTESNLESLDVDVQTDAEKAKGLAQDLKEKDQINGILRQLDKENAKKKLEIEQKREQMKIKIAKCHDDEDQKKRLMDQLSKFENNLTEQMKRETEGQNAKLLKALEERRNRRKKRNDQLAEKKKDKILSDFNNGAGDKVNMSLSYPTTKELADKISAGFGDDERVQVCENFLDKKSKQELLALMQSLFDERANALRKFIYELMKEKQNELQDLKEEFEPQKEILNQRRANNLISEDDYKTQMENLNKDEHDRRMEIEIEFADKEADANEQLEKARIEAENEQKKVLKDRQTQEKLMMFSVMMQKMEDGD